MYAGLLLCLQEFRAFGHGGKPKVLVMSYPCFRCAASAAERMCATHSVSVGCVSAVSGDAHRGIGQQQAMQPVRAESMLGAKSAHAAWDDIPACCLHTTSTGVMHKKEHFFCDANLRQVSGTDACPCCVQQCCLMRPCCVNDPQDAQG